MPDITIEGRTFTVDEEGFLQRPEIWDDEVARLFATTEGVTEMTPEHWAVVRMIRDHYLEHGNAPMVRLLCQKTGINLRTIFKLFPSGPAKGACKVAGLPKPEGCV
ncbi:MAG TPA: TusE/DsrC/DsvC family sulfur relay protein [Thermoanaerobaculaceae bacterium]|nr:TusE/DsrC/DsvC family sulfur relay protein [Thermoanaerobaculaceae bacterium]